MNAAKEGKKKRAIRQQSNLIIKVKSIFSCCFLTIHEVTRESQTMDTTQRKCYCENKRQVDRSY